MVPGGSSMDAQLCPMEMDAQYKPTDIMTILPDERPMVPHDCLVDAWWMLIMDAQWMPNGALWMPVNSCPMDAHWTFYGYPKD